MAMKALAAMFEKAGCTAVRTHIQSGNVVFQAPEAVARRIPDTIARAIRTGVGLTVPVVMRTAADLASVTKRNPFLKPGVQPEALHVAFLAGVPAADRVKRLDPKRSPGDSFTVRGRDIYLHLPNGTARSKLTNAWFDAALATVSTVRNWRTVLALAAMAASREPEQS